MALESLIPRSAKISRNPVGLIQGRLLSKYQGRYQAHPVGYWQEEFPRAASLGLDCIEFILDFNGADQNPLMRQDGAEEILSIVAETGVKVQTVCADIFMEAPLHHPEGQIAAYSKNVLERLLENADTLGVTDIVIPCVDKSSMPDHWAKDRFVRRLKPIVDKAEALNINLALETDLAPQPFAELLEKFDSRRVTVNYDTGNSAALGFDPFEELACYGDRISDIHIKDRVLNGGSVELGSGDTKFDDFFDALRKLNYVGPFILQAYRDDEGLAIFQKQLDWFHSRLSRWFGDVAV
jgi:sugar phosphate isomerase/epimerase